MSRCCIGAQGDCYELGKTIYIDKRDEAVRNIQLRPFCFVVRHSVAGGQSWRKTANGLFPVFAPPLTAAVRRGHQPPDRPWIRGETAYFGRLGHRHWSFRQEWHIPLFGGLRRRCCGSFGKRCFSLGVDPCLCWGDRGPGTCGNGRLGRILSSGCFPTSRFFGEG